MRKTEREWTVKAVHDGESREWVVRERTRQGAEWKVCQMVSEEVGCTPGELFHLLEFETKEGGE